MYSQEGSGIMSGKLNRKCQYCGEDNWWSIDDKNEFIEVCSNCSKTVVYKKSQFINKFKCDNCSSTQGILCDEDTNIKFMCRKCGTFKVIFEKHYVKEDNRPKMTRRIIVDKQPTPKSEVIKCPKCNSTQISTGKRGFSLMTGFIGANKTVNRCARCGYSWKPR